MNITSRALHRDLGYFYLGLIMSFALSGIMLNHRQVWHPERYTVETKEITITPPATEAEANEDFAKKVGKEVGVEDKFRRSMVRNGQLRISYEKHDIEIDLKTGKGEIVKFSKTPMVSQIIQLHKDTSVWWIYYSDIFGLSMFVIALTGAMMYPEGKFSFKQRGWKLTVAGIIFPLIFLFVLS